MKWKQKQRYYIQGLEDFFATGLHKAFITQYRHGNRVTYISFMTGVVTGDRKFEGDTSRTVSGPRLFIVTYYYHIKYTKNSRMRY